MPTRSHKRSSHKHKRSSRSHKRSSHKLLTSKGWAKMAPGTHERTVMQKDCGSKCFLGPVGESCFPICTKNTCEVNDKGIYAAYVRAREYGSPKMHRKSHKKSNIYGHRHSKKLYRKIASKAKILLEKVWQNNLWERLSQNTFPSLVEVVLDFAILFPKVFLRYFF